MNRKTVCFLLLVFVALSTLWAYAQAPPEEGIVLPRYQTQAEKDYEALMEGNGAGRWLWDCYPELAGHTGPPPSTSRFPTESEQTRGAMYGWPSYGCQMPELTELIRNSIRNVETTVLVPPSLLNSAKNCLRGRGFTEEDLDEITWFELPPITAANLTLDGVWIRDYGPEVLVAADKSLQFVDLGYYSAPSMANCTFNRNNSRPGDDVSPTRFSEFFQAGVNVFRPALRTEGGNLQTDGQGTCVRMQRNVEQRNRFSEWSYSREELDDVYKQYFNCTRVIALESLAPDPGYAFQNVIDHIDMHTTFISPTKVLMGQIDPDEDPRNATILDNNAKTLSEAGYEVVRIPQPARYCTVNTSSCIANPGAARMCGGSGLVRVWATYANSMRIGNKMIVPVYHDVPEELTEVIAAQEAEALETFQRELDIEFGKGAVQVVPVESDRMIPCQGSVHCITMTY